MGGANAKRNQDLGSGAALGTETRPLRIARAVDAWRHTVRTASLRLPKQEAELRSRHAARCDDDHPDARQARGMKWNGTIDSQAEKRRPRCAS